MDIINRIIDKHFDKVNKEGVGFLDSNIKEVKKELEEMFLTEISKCFSEIVCYDGELFQKELSPSEALTWLENKYPTTNPLEEALQQVHKEEWIPQYAEQKLYKSEYNEDLSITIRRIDMAPITTLEKINQKRALYGYGPLTHEQVYGPNFPEDKSTKHQEG